MADPSSDAWQRLHKVNEDLQNELEAQHKRQEMLNHQLQSIKHSYGEAKDTIRHHEAEILNLQARLSSASAELSIKEQALMKLKADLKLEKEKAHEMLEEWKNSEAALSSQLKFSQQKLKEVESSLLEKRQEIRELEMQQALQKDYQKEAQRLQEKLASLQAQLDVSEEAQILTEERFQMNYEELLDSYEKEKQLLILNLKETEARLVEYEDKLQEKDQVMEVLQKEKLNDGAEASVIVHHLEEQLVGRDAAIQRLKEHIKELELARDQLKTTCQEMVQQIAGSDSDIASLQNRIEVQEMEYDQLRSSLEKSTEDILKVQESLRDKEEELKNVYEAHRRLMGKKDQDINEALIKMAALGSSLEDTETKLKAKEEALKSLGGLCSESQAKEIETVYLQLETAKRRISEMEQCLQAEGGDVFGEVLTGDGLMEVGHDVPLASADINASSRSAGKEQDAGVKRQRIRFSSIQCQRYAHLDGTEKTWTTSPPSDTNQEQSLSEGSISPEMTIPYHPSGANDLDGCLSVIHSLENKLYLTEENLKDLTLKLENEKSNHQETLLALHNQWANAEASLREQLQVSVCQVNSMAKQMEEMQREKLSSNMSGRQMACCLEACSNLQTELHDVDESHPTSYSLSSIKLALSGIIHSLQKVLNDSSDTQGPDKGSQVESALQSPPDPIHRLSEKINFQAQLMYRMVESLKKTTSEDSLQVQEGERKADGSTDYLVEMFVRKVKLERDFWDRVDQIGKVIVGDEGVVSPKESELSLGSSSDLLQTLADNTLLKAELVLAIQKSKRLEADLKKAEAALEGLSVENMGTEPSGSQKTGRHQVIESEAYSSESMVCLEELSLHLKENADELKRISCALMSMSDPSAIQPLLQTTQPISSCAQSSSSPPLLVQDAVVQAQLCYVACKARLEYQRELRRSVDTLCSAQSEALSKMHQDYQEKLDQKQSELSEVLERERNAAVAVTIKVQDAERLLQEAEAKFKEAMSQLDSEYKSEMQNMMERWIERENALKSQQLEVESKLQASENEREEAGRLHWEKIRHLEAQFQEQLQELEVIHRNEMKTLEERYTQSIQQLQETLDSYHRDQPYTPSPVDTTTRSIASDQDTPGDVDSMNVLKGRILELEAQMDMMREKLDQRHPEGNMSSIKEKYQADFEKLKVLSDYIITSYFTVTSLSLFLTLKVIGVTCDALDQTSVTLHILFCQSASCTQERSCASILR